MAYYSMGTGTPINSTIAIGTFSVWSIGASTWMGSGGFNYSYTVGECSICSKEVLNTDNHTDIKIGENKIIYLCKECTEAKLGTIIVANEL